MPVSRHPKHLAGVKRSNFPRLIRMRGTDTAKAPVNLRPQLEGCIPSPLWSPRIAGIIPRGTSNHPRKTKCTPWRRR